MLLADSSGVGATEVNNGDAAISISERYYLPIGVWERTGLLTAYALITLSTVYVCVTIWRRHTEFPMNASPRWLLITSHVGVPLVCAKWVAFFLLAEPWEEEGATEASKEAWLRGFHRRCIATSFLSIFAFAPAITSFFGISVQLLIDYRINTLQHMIATTHDTIKPPASTQSPAMMTASDTSQATNKGNYCFPRLLSDFCKYFLSSTKGKKGGKVLDESTSPSAVREVAHLRIKKLKAIRTPAIAGVVILSSVVMMSKYLSDFTIIAKDVRNAKNDCSLQNATAVKQIYFQIFSLGIAITLAWKLRKVRERFCIKSHLMKVALWSLCVSIPLDLTYKAFLDFRTYVILRCIGYLVTYGIYHYYCGIVPILIANAEKRRSDEREMRDANPNMARRSSSVTSIGGGTKIVVVARNNSSVSSSMSNQGSVSLNLGTIGSVAGLRQVLMGQQASDSSSPRKEDPNKSSKDQGVVVGTKTSRKQSDAQQNGRQQQEDASRTVLLEFQKYLVTEFCVENALFLAEAVRFRQLAAAKQQEELRSSSPHQTELVSAAHDICIRFIKLGSESELNVSDNLRSEVVTRITTAVTEHSQQRPTAAPSLQQQQPTEEVTGVSSDARATTSDLHSEQQATATSSEGNGKLAGVPTTGAAQSKEQLPQSQGGGVTAAEFEAIESEVLKMCLPSYNRFVRYMMKKSSPSK